MSRTGSILTFVVITALVAGCASHRSSVKKTETPPQRHTMAEFGKENRNSAWESAALFGELLGINLLYNGLRGGNYGSLQLKGPGFSANQKR